MVTTSLVLETVRKVSVLGTDLDMLYESLKNFRGYAEISTEVTDDLSDIRKKLFWLFAHQEEGTAQRIKELIERAVSKRQRDGVNSFSFIDH